MERSMAATVAERYDEVIADLEAIEPKPDVVRLPMPVREDDRRAVA